ncbi:MAG: iron-sulfur cluster assembly accessory protein [Candidatus Rokubacteria bacterium]|nr:iron-sulfur cluster assembly accessory protein [Candidatus Rokubacteria bacterium]
MISLASNLNGGIHDHAHGGGCSAFSYELGWEDQAVDGDSVIESRGIKVYVDPMSTRYLAGSEVDFVDNQMLGAGFAIRNPNVKSSCGCGQSHQF